MSDEPLIIDSIGDHSRIIELLKVSDNSSVGRLLEQNWKRSLKAISKKLEAHEI